MGSIDSATTVNGRYVVAGVITQSTDASPHSSDTVIIHAHDKLLQRDVVLKAFRHSGASTDTIIREGASQARIRNKYVLAVYDAGSLSTKDAAALKLPAECPFLVLEHVQPMPGHSDTSLLAWLTPAPSINERYRIMLHVAEAVQAAHAVSVIHGDLKPENILVDATTGVPMPKLCDFGLSRLVGEAAVAGVRQYGLTPQYAAPEQFGPPPIGAPPTVLSDVYSLGATFYHVLTGTTPFQFDEPGASENAEAWEGYLKSYEAAHKHQSARRCRELDPKIDRDIDNLVHNMLMKNPFQRPPANEVVGVLRRFVRPSTIIGAAESPPQPVYVVDVELQEKAITDKPTKTLHELCMGTALGVLQRNFDNDTDELDAIYFGTMGLFRGSVTHAHIPTLLRDALLQGKAGFKLRRVYDGLNTCFATSESGALALLRAYEDIKKGKIRTALVVAGETMFSNQLETDEQRRQERRENNAWLKSALHYAEADAGLSLLGVGDMLMDHLQWRSGVDESTWREILETATLNKYEFALMYPGAMQSSKERASGRFFDARDYYDEGTNPFQGFRYRRHDVCPNANGATAILLSSSPPASSTNGRVRILGMGEGLTKVSIGDRSPPLFWTSAIRRSFRHLCNDAAVGPELFWDERSTSCILHDAFPAIELAFLHVLSRYARETDPNRNWLDIIRRYVQGWSNPFGGLSAGGHALGNSGLFQVAKAFHILTKSKYIDYNMQPPTEFSKILEAKFIVTTSVGSAISRVVSALLTNEMDARAMSRLGEARSGYRYARFFPRWTEDPLLEQAIRALPEDDEPEGHRSGIILGRTIRGGSRRTPSSWIYLVRGRTRFHVVVHSTTLPAPVGAWCRAEAGGRVEILDRVVEEPRAPIDGLTNLRNEMDAWRKLVLRRRYLRPFERKDDPSAR